MQVLGLQEAVEIIVAKDPRYKVDAYVFLRDALDFTLKRRRKNRKGTIPSHVTALELLEGFRDQALHEFGPMAITVLEYWGIKNSADIGQMVFHLIETGVLGKTDNDTLDSFSNALDFKQVFVTPFQPISSSTPKASLIAP